MKSGEIHCEANERDLREFLRSLGYSIDSVGINRVLAGPL
jgi:hypothetical protein